jgi:hypothetical protein
MRIEPCPKLGKCLAIETFTTLFRRTSHGLCRFVTRLDVIPVLQIISGLEQCTSQNQGYIVALARVRWWKWRKTAVKNARAHKIVRPSQK